MRREVRPRLLERRAEQHLRPRLQPHQLVREVDAFGHQALRLAQQLAVQDRQERRIEPDAVLDQDDRLDAHLAGVRGDVHAIFNRFHDRGQDPDIALPEEHAIDAQQLALDARVGEVPCVVGERDDRCRIAPPAERLGQIDDAHVADVHGGDDKVETAVGAGERQRLAAAARVMQARRIVRVEAEEPPEHALAQLAVFRQDERVVQARDEQDVVHAIACEILKSVQTAPGPEGSCGIRRHETQNLEL